MTDQSKYSYPVGKLLNAQTIRPTYTFTLHNDTGTVGTFDFNGPELRFTGNADAAAKVFIDFSASLFVERLKQERVQALEEAVKACEAIDDRCHDCLGQNEHEFCAVPTKEDYIETIRGLLTLP